MKGLPFHLWLKLKWKSLLVSARTAKSSRTRSSSSGLKIFGVTLMETPTRRFFIVLSKTQALIRRIETTDYTDTELFYTKLGLQMAFPPGEYTISDEVEMESQQDNFRLKMPLPANNNEVKTA